MSFLVSVQPKLPAKSMPNQVAQAPFSVFQDRPDLQPPASSCLPLDRRVSLSASRSMSQAPFSRGSSPAEEMMASERLFYPRSVFCNGTPNRESPSILETTTPVTRNVTPSEVMFSQVDK